MNRVRAEFNHGVGEGSDVGEYGLIGMDKGATLIDLRLETIELL